MSMAAEQGDDTQGYDTTRLEALRLELKRLNADAIAQGLLNPRGRDLPDEGTQPQAAAARPASPDKGKRGAKRMLTMLGRIPGDDSPPIPGTDFTESGVVRLLAHLAKPRKKPPVGYKFLQRLHRFLTRPVQMGMRTTAGASVERLRLVGRYLKMIEVHGWDYFQAYRAARRGKAEGPRSKEQSSPRQVARKRTRSKLVAKS